MKMTHTSAWTTMSIAFMLLCTSLQAQILSTYENDETGAAGTVVAGISVSDLTQVNGLLTDAAACGDGFNSKGYSLSTGAYNTSYTAVQFTVTPDPGFIVTITAMEFVLRRNNNGAKRMRYAFSTDGGTSWTDQGADHSVPFVNCNDGNLFSWDMPDIVTASSVIIRVYGWDANNINGVASLRDGVLYGEVCAPSTFYADTDGDGFGDAASSVSACTAPAGYVSNSDDCDDSQSSVYPGATEICDALDNDCDGSTDEDLVNATISPDTPQFNCRGTAVTFSTEPCEGCTYQWYKNDNILVGATETSYSTTKGAAHYNVRVTIPGGCSDTSTHVLLTTELNPNANIYSPNGTNLCAPDPGGVILLKVDYNPDYTYQWLKDGVDYTGAGATEWRIFPTETGVYRCHIWSPSGACDRITAPKTVINSCRTSEDVVINGVQIYPNPSTGSFTITCNLNSMEVSATITVYNAVGDVVYSNNSELLNGELNTEIGLSDIASGIYFVTVNAGNAQYTTNMVINK